MDAVKKFFANFYNHGTISIRRVRKEQIIITNREKTLPQELKSTMETETAALEPQLNKGTTTLDEVLEIPMSDLQDENTAADEIDDVLNIINEEENLKESLQLEIPRFDLQDLIESFNSSKKNLNGDDYMKINKLNSLDLSNESFIDLFDLEKKMNVFNSLDKQDKTDVLKEKKLNVQEDDVISISSDDSQAANENVKSNNKRADESKNVQNNEEINEPTNVNEGFNGVPSNVDSENIETNEAKNVNDEIEKINNEKTHPNNKSKEINDVNYKNEEPINMDKRISESKLTTNGNYEVNNTENDGLNHQAAKYITFIDGSDDDCGYHSSDFEFITEDEAKMDGLIVHIKPKMLKRKVNKLNQVKTTEITIDKCIQDNNKHSPNGNRHHLHESGTGANNFGRLTSIPVNDPEINNYGSGPSHLHESGAKIFSHGTSIPVNDPGINNCGPGPSHLHGNGPGANNFEHGPSNMQENSPGPNRLQGNVADLSGPSTERWQDYQLRKRLNRRQFVLNYGYRENHRIIEGEPYHQLFDPSFLPLPSHHFMGLLENKSTLSKNTMLVEYQGLGFDMRMLRECRDEEDENVKKEADESVKKILKMYPRENRKKRRRF